jgi:hypothetical protein
LANVAIRRGEIERFDGWLAGRVAFGVDVRSAQDTSGMAGVSREVAI